MTDISASDRLEYIAEHRKANFENRSIKDVPKPFIKWVGGKRQLLEQLHGYIPDDFNEHKYLEPFVGGGALFFYLMPEDAILIDNNPDLINCYEVIQSDVESFIKELNKHSEHKLEKKYFYQVRKLDRQPEIYSEMSDVEKAGRIIFLNKTCYNGLYRVNKKNQFNTPFGRYKNPTVCDEENLRAVHLLLQNVTILKSDFETVLDYAKADDFIYFDSPYDPLSNTANFTSYTKDDFGRESQKRLAETYKELDERGCKVLLSNSNTEFIKDLYAEFTIEYVKASRAINSDASKRGKIKEIIVRNFD